MNRYIQCPCDTKALYHKCCGRYHQGALPPTALDLMRSRYSAYVLCLPEYVMDTTHPDNEEFTLDRVAWKSNIESFSHETKFLFLKIVDHAEAGDDAEVTFTAALRQNSNDATFSEKSKFVRENGRWLYKSGETKLVD